MQLLHRKHAPTFTVPRTMALCQSRGCANHNALPCNYRDRRGHLCAALFCSDHRRSIGGSVYCRRHAGTIRALGERGRQRYGLPDLENRGPSLVNFVAGDLDAHVRALLAGLKWNDETVIIDEDVTQTFDSDRKVRWERAWKLVDSTGPVLTVTVSVDEHHDPRVTVKVGSEVVAESVPPWIARHLKAMTVADALDRAERQVFYGFLEEKITVAVNLLRAQTDNPSWG